MSTHTKALISWIPVAKGGRKDLPRSGNFRCDVRFESDPEWPQRGWTLVVRPIKSFRHGTGRFDYSDIAFLVDDAPANLLKKGNRFQLLDGLKVIAHGLVSSEGGRPPKEAKRFEQLLLC